MPTNIPYQPIQFDLPDYLTKPDLYTQLISENDKINFQVKADISETNLVTPGLSNNYTQDPSSQWVISGGRLSKVMGNDGRIYQSSLTSGEYYKLIINVLDLNTNGQVEISLGTNVIGTITTEGEHIFWGQAVANNQFSIYADSTTEVTIENTVEVYNVIDDINVIGIDLSGNLYVLSSSATFVKRDIAVFQDLEIPEADCFYLEVSNPEGEKVTEYVNDFSVNNANVLVGFTISGGTLHYDDIIGNAVFSETGLSIDHDLTLYFDIDVDSASNSDFYFEILDGTTFQTIYQSPTFNTSGNKTGVFSLTEASSYVISIVSNPTVDSNNELYINSIVIYSLQDSIISNNFKKITNTEGTLLLEASNDSDCFGFTFDNDFQFNLRFSGDVQMFLPEDEAEIYKDSRGVKKLYYAESEETHQIAFDSAPVYIVRAIQKMRLLNTLLLDGVEKVIFDNDFDLDVDSEKMNTGAFLVTDKEQNYFNYL